MFDCDVKTEQQSIALQILCNCADHAEAKGYKLPELIEVDFNLNSVTNSGVAIEDRKGNYTIQLHGKALEFYKEKFYETIIHEFAHIVQFVNTPHATGHDGGFYHIMRILGVPDATRCHDYDLYKVTGKKKRVQRRWAYNCGCQVHSVATVTHNRIQKGSSRICKKCKGELYWTGKEIK